MTCSTSESNVDMGGGSFIAQRIVFIQIYPVNDLQEFLQWN